MAYFWLLSLVHHLKNWSPMEPSPPATTNQSHSRSPTCACILQPIGQQRLSHLQIPCLPLQRARPSNALRHVLRTLLQWMMCWPISLLGRMTWMPISQPRISEQISNTMIHRFARGIVGTRRLQLTRPSSHKSSMISGMWWKLLIASSNLCFHSQTARTTTTTLLKISLHVFMSNPCHHGVMVSPD